MGTLPLLSSKQILKRFLRLGYEVVRQRGSHIRLRCQGKRSITVPDYRLIDRSLLRKILRDAELSVEDFEKLG